MSAAQANEEQGLLRRQSEEEDINEARAPRNDQRHGEEDDNSINHGDEEDASSSSSGSSEGDFPELEEEPLPAIMGPDDPKRMALTREEKQWALDIKDLVEMMPDLDNLSDFMYAQLALICEDNAEDAVRRAYGLQAFREEYNILDTYEDGCRYIRAMIDLFPEEFLSFSFSHQDGTYVLVHDASKLKTTNLTTPKKVEAFFAAAYYFHQAMIPDMESARKGTIVLVECSQYTFTQKQNFNIQKQLFSQLLSIYPFKGSLQCYHTGLVFNLLASMFRSVLPTKLKDKIKTGLILDQSLDAYYLVPSVEAAAQRVIQRMEETLKKRHENLNTFVLTDG